MTEHIDPALNQKERELQLVLAFDKVRDSYDDDEDPTAMFKEITRLLRSWFQAEACGIALNAESSLNIEFVTASGIDEGLAHHYCQFAAQNTDWTALTLAEWPHAQGVQINLRGAPLGGMFLARNSGPFTADEKALLVLAESMVDSAVISARTIWKYMARNRELAAITDVDRLRDYTPNESDLISGFTTLLLQHFSADLCLIILTQDNGEPILRGLINPHDLDQPTLAHIYHEALTVTDTQAVSTPPTLENFSVIAAPLVVGGVNLGAVVVGREAALKANDHRLLKAMAAQLDSAIIYSRTHHQWRQRNLELEAIYRIDRIRDQEQDFDKLLEKVALELCKAVHSEMGYIMLYNTREEQLELRCIVPPDSTIAQADYSKQIKAYSRKALDQGELVCDNHAENGELRSILAVPLILNQQNIGVFGAINSRQASGFTQEDRLIASAITSQVDTAVFERLEQRRFRNLLSRSVDAKVLEHLLTQADAGLLAGERQVLTVVFADLRNSTEWIERLPPEHLVTIINRHLSNLTEVIFRYGGTLDKFVGDEVISLFGSPLFMADHAEKAARAALDMQAAHRRLQAELAAEGHELPDMGIGISSGEAITGEFGPAIRTDFTAMGRIINLGARLCNNAAPGQISISQATYDLIKDLCEVTPLPPQTFKGISTPLPVYALNTMKDS